jgi:hypothetical protein
MTNWATRDDARDIWPDAPVDDNLLDAMLTSAHEVVEAYAPVLGVADPVPYRYVQAEVLQAIEHYQASQRNGDVLGFGDSGFAIRVRPLSTSVKSLLRPRRVRPAIGTLGQS